MFWHRLNMLSNITKYFISTDGKQMNNLITYIMQ